LAKSGRTAESENCSPQQPPQAMIIIASEKIAILNVALEVKLDLYPYLGVAAPRRACSHGDDDTYVVRSFQVKPTRILARHRRQNGVCSRGQLTDWIHGIIMQLLYCLLGLSETRQKMVVADFELLMMIGKGAFGEVTLCSSHAPIFFSLLGGDKDASLAAFLIEELIEKSDGFVAPAHDLEGMFDMDRWWSFLEQ
ncbi:hypothetical protein Tco_0853164, partial [Tanacetum coccineum]